MIALRLLRALDRALLLLEVAGVTVALLVMVALSFAEVVLRNARIDALPTAEWMATVPRHLVLWVGMLGASLAAGDRRHISIELISKAVSPHGRRVVEGLVDFAAVFICILLSYVAWRYVDFLERPDMHAILTIAGVKVMTWWSYMIMPVGFGLIAFRYFRLLVERIFDDQPLPPEHAADVEEYDRKHAPPEAAP